MKKLVPDPPALPLQTAAQCDASSLDRAATDRALDYYLHDHKPPRHVDQATYAIPDSVNLEAALAQASDLLPPIGVIKARMCGQSEPMCLARQTCMPRPHWRCNCTVGSMLRAVRPGIHRCRHGA